jgi:hypothetical protein
VISPLSFTIIVFPSSAKISPKAILLIAALPSFFTSCSIALYGVKRKPYLSTFEYEAK